MKQIFSSFTFLFLILSSTISWCAPAIIWDLGGVLFKPNKFRMAYREIGLTNIVWYAVRDLQNPKKIQKRAFEILYHLGKQQTDIPSCYPDIGLELPQIMCDWLEEKTDSEAIIKTVDTLIEELDRDYFFVSVREKNLLKKVIRTMFNPIILAKYMEPVTQACPLLENIIEYNCEQFILSNWDAESFNELYASEHGQKIFKYFKPENIIISGKCGIMKPKKEIFELIFRKYDLNPFECIFIDDQQENIKTAETFGISSILFDKNMNFNKLCNEISRITDTMTELLSFCNRLLRI